jgi:hypothetical protein
LICDRRYVSLLAFPPLNDLAADGHAGLLDIELGRVVVRRGGVRRSNCRSIRAAHTVAALFSGSWDAEVRVAVSAPR